MATKTATILARIEPEVKEQAEAIMSQLGVPTSVVINMLYKQIIMTKSIPFPLSIPSHLPTRDQMDDSVFNAVMTQGLDEAKKDLSLPVSDVFDDLKKEL